MCIYFFIIVGEIFELKAELNSDKKDRKKEAVKKVIASMTVGKDVRYNSLLCKMLKMPCSLNYIEMHVKSVVAL